MVLAQDLRNAVLQAALQGKLTEQLETDSSVDILLQDIKLEKKNLIDKGEIKREKVLSSIDKEDIPFEIPYNWKWTRMQDILDIRDGTHDSPTYQISGVPFITSKNLIDGKIDFNNVKYISQEDADLFNKRSKVNKNDILMAMIGSIGKPVLVDCDKEFAIKNVALLKKVPNTQLNMTYILLLLYYSEAIMKNQSLGGVQKFVSLTYLRKYIIPLPPIEEQQRIVDRVNELMEKIDDFEKVEKELVTLEQKFPDDMKNALLQAAMQGKLTEQFDGDSSVDEMVDAIKEEKKQLIKEKKIKKEKPLPPIEEDEIPFDIPDNWRWERFANIAILNPRNNLDDALEVSFIPMTLISDGYNNGHTAENRIWKDVKKGFTHIKEGDLGFAKITPCFQNRKSVIFKNLVNGYAAGTTELHIIRTISNSLLAEYLLWFVKSPYFIDGGVNTYTGTAGQQRIHKDYLPNCLVPIPPIEEQQRIVERLEQLLPLCETL